MAKKGKTEEHTPSLHEFFGDPIGGSVSWWDRDTCAEIRPVRTGPAEGRIIDPEEEESPGVTAEIRLESQPTEGSGTPLNF